jgi:hypothetical protein
MKKRITDETKNLLAPHTHKNPRTNKKQVHCNSNNQNQLKLHPQNDDPHHLQRNTGEHECEEKTHKCCQHNARGTHHQSYCPMHEK